LSPIRPRASMPPVNMATTTAVRGVLERYAGRRLRGGNTEPPISAAVLRLPGRHRPAVIGTSAGTAIARRRQFESIDKERAAASVSAKQRTEKDFFWRPGPDALLRDLEQGPPGRRRITRERLRNTAWLRSTEWADAGNSHGEPRQ
jgi:hypothetical protein